MKRLLLTLVALTTLVLTPSVAHSQDSQTNTVITVIQKKNGDLYVKDQNEKMLFSRTNSGVQINMLYLDITNTKETITTEKGDIVTTFHSDVPSEELRFYHNSRKKTLEIYKAGAKKQLLFIVENVDKTGIRTVKNKHKWWWDQAHYNGVTLKYDGLVGGLDNLNLPTSTSWMSQSNRLITGVELNFLDAVLWGKGCFGIFTGAGLEMNNYYFSSGVTLGNDPTTGFITPDYSYVNGEAGVKYSKLSTTYLKVPLGFEFQFGGRNRGSSQPWWINVAAVGGVRINAHTKVKENDKAKHKNHDNLNIPRFRYGIEASIGYEGIGLTASYYPQSIFTPAGGPDVKQVSIGLSFKF